MPDLEKRTKIIVAEDDKNQRNLLDQELTDQGYEVTTAKDGYDVLRKIDKQRPDLVVMDISMPKMDGIEALGKLLGIDNTIPVILYTAYANYRDNLLAWAADAFVVKTSDLSDLVKTVEVVLKKRAEEAKQKQYS